MVNKFQTSGGLSGEFDEEYRRDPATAQWAWTGTEPNLPTFQEEATAGLWTGEQWVFEGRLSLVSTPPPGSIASARTFTKDIRMVYTALGSAAFRREFEDYRDGNWVTTSASTCTRVS